MKAEKVKFNSSFEFIFGKDAKYYSESERKNRWQQWKDQVIKNKDGQETIDYWTDNSACQGCRHLNVSWCDSVGLPCTVNPVLSFSMGMIGLACCGAGREELESQL